MEVEVFWVAVVLFVLAIAARHGQARLQLRGAVTRRSNATQGAEPPPAGSSGTGAVVPVDSPPREKPRGVPRSCAIVVRRGPTRYPILLAHGFLGFDAVGSRRIRSEYFRGVRRALEELGVEVHVGRVSPIASVARRAGELAAQIARFEHDRVNIIAHSMGGVDARYAISRLDLWDRVASLVTVGTPHRGTPLADLVAAGRGTRAILRHAGSRAGGLHDLTTSTMGVFNHRVLDARGVVYASVVGSVDRAARSLWLAPGHAFLKRRAGPNDGIVPASSQRWGDVLGEIEADHWAQIGWSFAFDARPLYLGLARELGWRGL